MRHRRAADRAGRHRLLDFAVFGLHQGVDLARDLAAGRGQEPEQADVLGQVIADRACGYSHRQHAEGFGDAGLHRRALRAERGKGARTTAEHRHEQARGGLLQPLHMADHLVDPHRRLVSESRRQGVLTMRAPGDRHFGAAFGEIGHRGEGLSDQTQEDAVGPAQHQQIAGLRDVLRRCPPMHPPAVRVADDPAELPDQWHDGVAGAREPLVDPRPVEQFEPSRARDRFGSGPWDDAELALRLGKRRLHVEPGLPPVFLAVEFAYARVRNASRSREFIGHGVLR